jgi:uncharacterized protein HemX
MLAASSSAVQQWWSQIDTRHAVFVVTGSSLALLAIKILVGISLVNYAGHKQQKELTNLEIKLAENPTTASDASKRKVEMVEELLSVNRYTVYKGRII